jgi:hypothetical protein
MGLAIVVTLAGFGPGRVAPSRADGVIALQAPAFVGVAAAEGEAVLAGIADEAGIAAYFDKGQAITLSSVRGLFRTIEVETATYLLGSMQATGSGLTAYPESEDPHVYVNTNGWVMAYYLSADPAGKIVDVYNYAGGAINTKLELVLNRVAPGYTPTFYDFRYPTATKLLLVVDQASGADDSFTVNLPSTFPNYYERSWALEGYYTTLELNGSAIGSTANYNNTYGTLTPAQLGTDQTHTVLVNYASGTAATGALAVIYRDVP